MENYFIARIVLCHIKDSVQSKYLHEPAQVSCTDPEVSQKCHKRGGDMLAQGCATA